VAVFVFLMVFCCRIVFSRVVKASRAGSLVLGGELGLRCVVYQKPFQMGIVR
jgi:hypothetical protein